MCVCVLLCVYRSHQITSLELGNCEVVGKQIRVNLAKQSKSSQTVNPAIQVTKTKVLFTQVCRMEQLLKHECEANASYENIFNYVTITTHTKKALYD